MAPALSKTAEGGLADITGAAGVVIIAAELVAEMRIMADGIKS
jgi:hypothetical protein